METHAGLALGSNLGNRLSHLCRARDLLKRLTVGPLLQAPIYQTAPVACPDGSSDFYNTVVEIVYAGAPHQLLAAVLGIELALGRTRPDVPNASRLIDIDLLYFGGETLATRELELPHPRLTSRRFVLRPLADIRPGLILPGSHVTIAEHLTHLDSDEPELVLVQASW